MHAHKLQPSAPALLPATLIACDGDDCRVRDAHGEYRARRAFSCLIVPEPGDQVLLAEAADGTLHLIAITARPESRDAHLQMPGNLDIATPNGGVRFTARDPLTLSSAKGINLVSTNTVLKTGDLTLDFTTATARGKRLTSAVDSVRSFGELLDSAVKTVVRRAVTYVRHSESLDQVKAGQMDREVKGLYNMHSNYTVMLSRKDTRIDGERIHMG